MTDRELDALIAEKVMGYAIPKALAPAVYVEGEWSIHADRDETDVGPESGWMCHSSMEPVMVKPYRCMCSIGPILGSIEHMIKTMGDEWSPEEITDFVEQGNRKELEEWANDHRRWGHSSRCLEVVPHYSTDMAAAWTVIEYLREHYALAFELFVPVSDSPVICRFYRADTSFTGETADTGPRAICLAALKAVAE